MEIKINDCTIRDGGYLLDKNSPDQFVRGISEGLLLGGVDIIEIGFLQDVVNNESIIYKNSQEAKKNIIDITMAQRFTGFCDNSRYSLENLDEYNGTSFEYLRVSFAKHERDEAFEFISGIKEKGYKVFANPMDTPSYTPEEISEMILKVNEIQPFAFSIVDTFGTMYLDDLKRIFTQYNKELDNNITVGLHSHNNLHLSNALAETFIDMAVEFDRDIVVDGSLYGMGRGAGNANTEVIASYLNVKHGKDYDLGILFNTIDKYIVPLKSSVAWGYDLPMFICGAESSHVDNIYYLQDKKKSNLKEVYQIIKSMDPSKRRRYGENYSKADFSALEEAYQKYLEEKGEN